MALYTSDTYLQKSDDAAFDWRKDRGPLDTRIHTLSDYPLLIGEILRSMEHFRISTTGIGLPLFFASIFLNLTGTLFNLRFQDD